MGNQCYGLDLGSNNLKVYCKEGDKILQEKNIVAVENKKKMIAYGDEAYAMYEKAPASIDVSFPMSYGNIGSINHLEVYLKSFLEKQTKGAIKGAEYFMALPTDVQDRVFTTLIQDSGLKPHGIHMVDMPVAAGLGLGINVKEAQGVMVVDIGADTTEVSILSLGGIVISRLIKIGGNQIDEAIISAIRKEYNFYIGSKTAAQIKKELAYAVVPENGEEETMEICGRNMVLGLPALLKIDAKFVSESIQDVLKQVMDTIKVILERTPPELGVDMIRNGIYLTGGSSQLKDVDVMIYKATGIRVVKDENPEQCVIRGLARVINEKEFRSLTFTTKEQEYK
ncbi:MAG: rod shape-determining protein [Lachnospiraceae bacterium]